VGQQWVLRHWIKSAKSEFFMLSMDLLSQNFTAYRSIHSVKLFRSALSRPCSFSDFSHSLTTFLKDLDMVEPVALYFSTRFS